MHAAAAGSEGAPHRKSAKIHLNSSKPRNLSPWKQYFTFDEIRDALMGCFSGGSKDANKDAQGRQ
jgi:hypothetical protein